MMDLSDEENKAFKSSKNPMNSWSASFVFPVNQDIELVSR